MNKKHHGFTIIEALIVVVIIGLIGLVGWIYFSKTQQPKSTPPPPQATKVEKCKDATTSAINGTFCSSEVGISMQVPDLFKAKLEQTSNYEIFTQNTLNETPSAFGMSDIVYQAAIKGEHDEYKLTIAKEPLRNFRLKTLAPALFSKDSQKAHYIESNNQREVESINLDGTKFYTYAVGDAGMTTSSYMAIINNKIIIISLSSAQQPGNPETRNYLQDPATLMNEFKSKIKTLKVV